ncbi:diacylglycerol/lipid kinase family protein [Gimesia fumaroli]|uniref:Lipid kinase BmrU n=1 Tax=Gimesia fumaroli TaxID=2527976 RepID=A0A518IIL6_9PLAN|nr:YegS/Rv2252/BmrU family lipid kinase [Gimesia fumaroli]QDV52880.1 Putative lipid kinase BmrU [Gimesia fumaroli]
MTNPWVAIQRNPISGTGNRAALLMDLIFHLKQNGIRPRLFSNRDRLQSILSARSAEDQPVCVVAAGGDGTVQDVVNRYPNHKIAILPLGTENLLARYFGIEKSGQFVAEMIATGNTREVDLCEMNQRKFILMASIGFDAAVVETLTRNRTGNITHLSYLKPIWNTLCAYPFKPLQITIDGEAEEITAYHAIVVNIPAYGLNLNFAPTANDHDGLLDLIVLRKKGIWSMLKYVFRIIRGTHLDSRSVQKRQARQIRIQSAEPVPIQTDGDACGSTPAEIKIMPSAGRFIVPCSTLPNDQ